MWKSSFRFVPRFPCTAASARGKGRRLWSDGTDPSTPYPYHSIFVRGSLPSTGAVTTPERLFVSPVVDGVKQHSSSAKRCYAPVRVAENVFLGNAEKEFPPPSPVRVRIQFFVLQEKPEITANGGSCSARCAERNLESERGTR